MSQHYAPPPFTTALAAGGIAGTTVDLSLFPLDTLKTRLQSSEGFIRSGGFRGVYRGVGSAVVGSAPGAAFFFCTYEGVKDILARSRTSSAAAASTTTTKNGWIVPLEHMAAASLGEVAACAVRVPTEVIKQRAQAGQHGGSSARALQAILFRENASFATRWTELYRGWGITVMREVPFTVIQFPLWEAMKAWGRQRRRQNQLGGKEGVDDKSDRDVGAGESALYGSISGAVAAGLTTPLDVIKTRVMLSQDKVSVGSVARDLFARQGVRPFFAGIGPRVMWISAGGAIFLGSYQWAVNTMQGHI